MGQASVAATSYPSSTNRARSTLAFRDIRLCDARHELLLINYERFPLSPLSMF
jgi:hypothetical protein